MRRKLAIVATLGLLAMPLASVSAHHAFTAEFDADKPMKFVGTLTSMEWINPHTWLHVEVAMPDGKVENWAVECGTPSALYRRGLTKADMPKGLKVSIEGFASKDGSKRMNGRDLKMADGRSFFLGSSGTGAPYDGRDPSDKK